MASASAASVSASRAFRKAFSWDSAVSAMAGIKHTGHGAATTKAAPSYSVAAIPPSPGAARVPVAPGASPAPGTKAYRNIPSAEFDESPVEEVRVLDPRHPLYGRSFRVIRRAAHRGGNFPSSFEVEHCNGSSLLIPIAVTEWHDLPGSRTTLSIDALRELIDVVDCLDDHGDRPERSLDDAAAVSAASDRRRRRRGPGGGPS